MKRIANSFWEHLAKNYPSFKDPSMRRDVKVMIERAEAFGIDFENKKVLDIGCGTGTVAIPLAKKNAHITATDISLKMLHRLEKDARDAGVLNNIKSVQSDWESFDLLEKFDIVLASMTPALFNEELTKKYINATENYGIFVGWGEYKYNDFFEDLLHAHGREFRQGKNSTKKFYQALENSGFSGEISYFESEWNDHYSPLKAFHYAVQHLRRDHIKLLKFNEIKRIIKQHTINGKVTVSNRAQKGIVLWKVQ